MHKSSIRWMFAGLLALALALVPTSFGQGVTSIGISGFVTNKAGAPVIGAKVTAVHVPTGTRAVTTTSSGGRYAFDGLRPGGPYTVSVEGTEGSGQAAGLYGEVGNNVTANVVVSTDVIQLEAVSVGASRDTTFDASQMGTSTQFNSKEVGRIVSVRQDVQDLENLDPRATLAQSANGDGNYVLSVQGQNPRANLILIDGVSASDNFGLNSNGYAGLRSPLPLDWIESFSFDLNHYDVAYSGFTGAVANAVLKSGTNSFHGTAYELYTGTNFRGPDPVIGPLGPHEKLQNHTTGATLGGPIIKDKLFFFVGYEAFRELAQPQPALLNVLDNAADIATINQILGVAASEGYTKQGTFTAPLHIWQQNFVGKIDWNISDNHKFEFTFRHNDGQQPLTYNYTYSNETSLSGSWYDSHRVDQSYTAKINSDWGYIIPTLKTEIEGTFRKYNGTAIPEGTLWPAVTIYLGNFGVSQQGSTFNELFLGTSASYQSNNLYTQEAEEHVFAEYTLGAHTFKFGAQVDRIQLTNTFIQNTLGSYTFSNIQDFLNATPTGAQKTVPSPGHVLQDSIAHFYQLNLSPSFQDTWKPNDRLTILAGVRMDYPYMTSKPPLSSVFLAATGYPNTETINGHYTVSPRVGFNYDLGSTPKTQIHGGFGLFMASPPYVWLENSFNNAGLTTSATVNNSSTPIAGYTFTGASTGPVPAAAGAPTQTINFIAPDFHNPANWKENIAIDHDVGFGGLTVTLAGDWTQVQKDVYYTSNNMKLATSGPAFLPNGAIRYAGNITPTNVGSNNFVPGYTTTNYYLSTTGQTSAQLEANPSLAQVLELNNTDKGGSQEYTASIGRKLKAGWGYSLAYTHTHATQVAGLGGTTASGGFSPFVNPNDNIAYKSLYAADNKVVATLTHEHNFFKRKNMDTTISAQFIAQTGQAFSYTFKGDADGSGLSSNQLFYVPSGPNDPNVEWISPVEETNFFNWLAQHPDLAKWAGKTAPRNAFNVPWQKTVNLNFNQDIGVYGDVKVSLFASCFNFANLLSKKWGVVSNYGQYNDSQGKLSVAGTGFDPAGNGGKGAYMYTFNPGTLGLPVTYSDLSRWFLQVGARLTF